MYGSYINIYVYMCCITIFVNCLQLFKQIFNQAGVCVAAAKDTMLALLSCELMPITMLPLLLLLSCVELSWL